MKKILQGTDGIRGYTKKIIKGQKNPVLIFEKQNILTPEFFELYGYVFCLYLQNKYLARIGDYIMVGRDTRDTSSIYTDALLKGIFQAGMKVRFLDIVPTPLVPFYLVKRNRAGGMMITASHNPADQNGIKLFLPPNGIKLLPEQEQELTKLLYDTPYPISTRYKPVSYKNLNQKVIKKYTRHLIKNIHSKKFSKTILKVDCANGAVTRTLQYLFKRLKFQKINLYNTEGKINHYCGITQLEGWKTISMDDMKKNENLAKNKLLNSIFEEAKNNIQVKNGEFFLRGFVFDGDGDRFMRLEYDCFAQKIYLLTGDALALEFLTALHNKNENIHFYHTIESDLKMKTLADKMGWKQGILPIGDKWLLAKAQEQKKFFSLGYEESGHFVLPKKIKIRGDKMGARRYFVPKRDIFFSGDGIFAAIKSLEVIYQNHGHNPSKSFYYKLANHYQAGIFKNMAIYNIDKSILLQKEFEKKLTIFMQKTTEKSLTNNFQLEKKQIAHSPDLHYWFLKQKNTIQGAIFLRNSGTENKVSLYLRGEKEFEAQFSKIFKKLELFLIPYLQVKK